MAADQTLSPGAGRVKGSRIALPELGSISIGGAMTAEGDVSVHRTDHDDVLVRVFDLACGIEGEVSLGPYTQYQAEVHGFERAYAFPALAPQLPQMLGHGIVLESGFAFIAQTAVRGQHFGQWITSLQQKGWNAQRVEQVRQALFDLLGLGCQLVQDGMLWITLRPEDVLHAASGDLALNNLSGLWTHELDGAPKALSYVARVSGCELLLDVMHLQAEEPLGEPSMLYALGVWLLECLSGQNFVSIDQETAQSMLSINPLVASRDTRIRELWHQYPHLEGKYPLLTQQLEVRQLGVTDFWYVLGGYLNQVVEGWDDLPEEEKDALLLSTGSDVFCQHLQEPFQWIAPIIAQATISRRLRLPSVEALHTLMRDPIDSEQRLELEHHNQFVQYLQDLGEAEAFLDRLNRWDVRKHSLHDQWALQARVCDGLLSSRDEDSYVTPADPDAEGHFYYRLFLGNSEEVPIPVSELNGSRSAWII